MGNINSNPNTKPNSTKEINMKKNTDTNPNTKSTKEINIKKNTDTNPNTKWEIRFFHGNKRSRNGRYSNKTWSFFYKYGSCTL